MIVILDHQDSFTYNIYAAIKALGEDCKVLSTLNTNIVDIEKESPTKLILSPGPGHPDEAPLFFEALKHYEQKIPILGICLGHQAIARFYGGSIKSSRTIVHGKSVKIEHNEKDIYKGFPQNFQAMRYNSLTVDTSLPPHLEPTSWSGGELMGLKHKTLPIQSVQFHPESVGTPNGYKLLANFLNK